MTVRIHERVRKVKASEEVGVKYMQAWEEKYYEKEEAREEGRREGLEQGHRDGLEQGYREGLEQGIRILILDNLEEEIPKERIIAKLQIKYELDKNKAEEYFQQYSENK